MTTSSTALPADADRAGDETIRESVDIAAPPERVFDALTDPGQLARWWGAPDTYRTDAWTVDPRPGGALGATTRDASGREGSARGEYRIVDRPRTLEHTWHPDDEPAPSLVRFDLEPAAVRGVPGTRVTVTHTRLVPTLDLRASVAPHAASSATTIAWIARLDRLARIVRVRSAALPPSFSKPSRRAMRAAASEPGSQQY